MTDNFSSLDPDNWQDFRNSAHQMLDAALDRMQGASDGPVWTPLPPRAKAELTAPVPAKGQGADEVVRQITALLPYGVGNTHPRFFGWVHGSGTAGAVLPAMAAAAMNANLGGRDHGAIYVERQVLDWCRDLMGFPRGCGGLIVSGTSMATVIAMKAARDQRTDFASRKTGAGGLGFVGYTSEQSHSCNAQAFDILGLGSDAMRKIPCNEAFEMDLNALQGAIAADRAAGLTPLVVIGTAGAVNMGAIDDLHGIAEICAAEEMWFHIDGAIGAAGRLSDKLKPRLAAFQSADSLAFDFHKWLHVAYDAGCILIRDEEAMRRAFSDRPEYLAQSERGLAAGGFWPVDYGPELSRGFRALKIWTHFLEHGTEALGNAIDRNCDQAQYLAARIKREPVLELLAPVPLQIVCFRYGSDDALNDAIVIALQESGVAAPSTTKIDGKLAIRVNLTNHRTRESDLDLLVDEVLRLGGELA